MQDVRTVNVIGAGLSGLSASINLARAGIRCNLISSQPSERAQSVLAEGGINAALDTMGEHDTVEEHFADTMKGGVYLESEEAVKNLTSGAPDVVRELVRLGVPFRSENGTLILRNFGGQKKKRTAYAKSSSGKIIMTALIDETRKYETEGLITRYPHHEVIDLAITGGRLDSFVVRDSYSGEQKRFTGITILCTGGMNGFFEGMTTGTTQNTGNVDAIAFARGVAFANLEFLQYHPTTVGISNKRMLISEAARGEGGRLFILRDGKPWYFMEEKYPVMKNLMPRDVVSREMTFVSNELKDSPQVYLDMVHLEETIWTTRLSDLREEIIAYMHLDPKEVPIPVSPGIHFCMGGIRVNVRHETNIRGLLAAGEAACRYHGANRLGGNSLLGAVFGGKTAAETLIRRFRETGDDAWEDFPVRITEAGEVPWTESSPEQRRLLREALLHGLGILRSAERMNETLQAVEALYAGEGQAPIDRDRARLGLAMIRCAIQRKESRGAHYRTDYPETDDENFRKFTCVQVVDGEIRLDFMESDDSWERS